MPIKMVMETEEQRVHMNITANQCPGCPENLAARLVMQPVFAHLSDQAPIVFGQGCGIGRDFLQRSGLGTHDSEQAKRRPCRRMRMMGGELIAHRE